MICSQHNLAQTHRSISYIQDGSVRILYLRKCLDQAQIHAESTTSRTQTPGKVSGSQKSRPVAERFGCGSTARIARKRYQLLDGTFKNLELLSSRAKSWHGSWRKSHRTQLGVWCQCGNWKVAGPLHPRECSDTCL